MASGNLRTKILDAGARIFAIYGYDGTTTRDIAVAAECGEPSVYRLFGSKAKLFAAVLEHVFSSQAPLKVDCSQPPEKDIPRMMRETFENWESNPYATRLFYGVALMRSHKQASRTLQRVLDLTYAPVIETIKQRQKAGEYRSDISPLILAAVFVGLLNYDVLLHDFLNAKLICGERVNRKAYRDALVTLLLEGARPSK